MRVFFVGLGTMGYGMAQNLVNKNFSVTVYNRTRSRTQWFTDQDVRVVDTPSQGASGADAIITMLSDDRVVKEVILDPVHGIVQSIGANTLLINCSTVSPALSLELFTLLETRHHVRVLDAPVTGSAPQAKSGSLTFMVGGNFRDFQSAVPLFAAMGSKWLYMGPQGTGSMMKLANNTIVALNMMAVVEGMNIAVSSGIDPEMFLNVISNGGARNGMAESKREKILANNYRPDFTMALMLKDLKLASRLAEDLHLPLPGLALVKELYESGCRTGGSELDMAALWDTYQRMAGQQNSLT